MGCRKDEGEGKKTDGARGGWAEDARRPPATLFYCRVDLPCARDLGKRTSIYYEPGIPRMSFSEGQRPIRCLRSEKFHLSTLVLVHSIAERVECLQQETPK